MKFDIYQHRDYCIASDTDSAFFNAYPLLEKEFGDLALIEDSVLINKTKEIAKRKTQELNNYLDTFIPKLFNVKNRIEFKNESILKSAYWSGKRRYAQYIVDKEGVKVEELDLKGLDLMKSNFPPLFREFGEKIITDICFGETKVNIDKKILDFKKSLSTVSWKKLLKPTGLNKLEEYINEPPKFGEIFTSLKSKCPINTKSAIIYNDILRYKKLDKKYPLFQVGDKMFIAYLRKNEYNIKSIGFNGYQDPPEVIEFIEKNIDKEKMFDSVMKNKIDNLYIDLKWDLPIYNTNFNKFFTF